jgi:hypothetical protein
LASYKNYLKALQSLAIAGLGIFAGCCLFSTNAVADACSHLTGQYNLTLRAYQSSKFQFPEDCARANDYFRGKREQAQSVVSAFHAAQQACGPQFGRDRGPPPEQLAALLEHEAVMLETGCNVLAGSPAPEPAPRQPPPALGVAPVTAALPSGQPQAAPPPPNQTAAPPPNQAAPTPPNQAAPPPNQTAAVPSGRNGPQSCAVQKTMSPAPGCIADFPQLLRGAACTAADNSVGLTLQVPGSEPTCCVTSCGRSK